MENNCKICGKDCLSLRALVNHLKIHKISSKEYYDKFYKTEDEGYCKNCGNPVNFSKLSHGYNKYCSLKCSNSHTEKIKLQEKTTLNHYGVKHPSQSKIIQERMKETTIERYGVENVSQSELIKKKKENTFLKHYRSYFIYKNG